MYKIFKTISKKSSIKKILGNAGVKTKKNIKLWLRLQTL